MIKHTRIHTFRVISLLATVAALALIGPVSFAHAGDATKAQYKNPVTKVAADVGGGGPADPSGLQKRVVGGLPFTGLDVAALLAVAVALTSMGLALRRLTAERHLS